LGNTRQSTSAVRKIGSHPFNPLNGTMKSIHREQSVGATNLQLSAL
jgi:hypothetical protein